MDIPPTMCARRAAKECGAVDEVVVIGRRAPKQDSSGKSAPLLYFDGLPEVLCDACDACKRRGAVRDVATAPVELAHCVLPKHECHLAVNGRLKPAVDERSGASLRPVHGRCKRGQQHVLARRPLPTGTALARARLHRADGHGWLGEAAAERLDAAVHCYVSDRRHSARGTANVDAERGRVGAKPRPNNGQIRAARQRALLGVD